MEVFSMYINTIPKLRFLIFISVLINPIVSTSYANEIICSKLITSYLEGRYGRDNFRLFFPPLLKITNEYIYLSDNNKTDTNIEWYAKIKNQNGSLKNAMAIRPVVDDRSNRKFTAIVRYNYKENNNLHTITQVQGFDNLPLQPNIYKECVLYKASKNEVPKSQAKQPQSSNNNVTYNSQKQFCSEIGFQPGTESFGNCVLKMMDKN